ncbi:MAG: hypothetical protein H3C69_07100 [Candidatus Promineofilum sp.]|nr:hypothetical protein [Promineifilum sp.]
MYNEGISRTGDVLDLAIENNLLDKRGAFIRYRDTLLGQGRENAKSYLAQNPDMLLDLESQIRQSAGLPAIQTQ